jgi:hypothetical protein
MRATIANLSTHQRVKTPSMSGSIKYFDEKVVFLEFDNGKHHHLKTGEFISSVNSNKYTLVGMPSHCNIFRWIKNNKKLLSFV